jgi:galactose mutarotase-like enzyme
VIEMTYRLENGALEVATAVTNLSTEAMPVAIGFHPYFQLTDSPRDEWTIAVGARTHCFEPMAGITNAINMAHKGTYKELQTIAPGGVWRESFWIRPSGF